MKILITAGGTREYIDGARFIGNASTGKTACAIAENLIKEKFEVICLCSENSVIFPKGKSEIIRYSDFKNLNAKIKKILSENQIKAVIHAAAVSDYSIEAITAGNKKHKPSKQMKIKSNALKIHLTLKRNFKILNRLKGYSKNKKTLIIGFKLTNNASAAEISRAVSEQKSDYCAHNDISQIGINHPFTVYKKGELLFKVKSPGALAKKIHSIIREEICS